MTDWMLVGLGLVILLLAGDALVRGAVNLSLRLGIPALIVSLTIVAFGTSAPELLIAVSAILEGAPGLALGNVIGSNTANILLVLGMPALLARLETGHFDTRKTYAFMILASVLFTALCFLGPITWLHGLVLLAGLSLILGDAFRIARHHRRTYKGAMSLAAEEAAVEGADPDMPWSRIALFLGLGLVGLPLGAELLVESSVNIALRFGISETVIGLTLLAVGTSLPELATTIMAALRGQADVALGNVIGSNMFNVLAIIGIASFVGPIPISAEVLSFDLWVMLGASLLIGPFVFRHMHITRRWGVVLTTLYVVYVSVVLF